MTTNLDRHSRFRAKGRAVQQVTIVVDLDIVFCIILLLAVLNIRVDDILAELSAMGFDHFSIQCQLFHNATDPSQYAPLNPKGSAWNVGDYREGIENRLIVVC